MIKLIAVSVICTVLTVSCGSSDDSEFIFKNDWGYNSLYTGNAAEANPTGDNIVQDIVKPMINAINFGNGIYLNAVKIMLPNLFTSTTTVWKDMIDNGSCYPKYDNGTISYRAYPPASTKIDSKIVYNYYCVESTLNNNTVIINDNATMESSITKVDNASIYDNKSILKTDSLSIQISRVPSTITYNFRGFVQKSKQTRDNGSISYEGHIIGADMPEEGKVFRFDFATTTFPIFSKIITFYHPEYGYVTADLNFLTNETLGQSDEITVKYKNGSCTFTPKEIGTKDFKCDKKL